MNTSSHPTQEEYSTLSLHNKHCIITGASRGIGKAIALRLAAAGAHLHLIGRSEESLNAVKTETAPHTSKVQTYEVDLMDSTSISSFTKSYRETVGNVDILIQNAGILKMGSVSEEGPEIMDQLYTLNLRAPYELVHQLLPAFSSALGQIIFMNSTVRANANISQYAASKHALKTFTDSLRAEVNEKGIRVMSLFAGRTATDMVKGVFEKEGRTAQYRPERLLQPEDIAETIHHMLTLPLTAEITDLTIRPFLKSY